jgi:hypothetical protein
MVKSKWIPDRDFLMQGEISSSYCREKKYKEEPEIRNECKIIGHI